MLVASGCVVGVLFYAAMAFAHGPVLLLALQPLNAWFFAVVAGVGLPLFQTIIPEAFLRVAEGQEGVVTGSTMPGETASVIQACPCLSRLPVPVEG